MRADWNHRAKEDAYYYVAFGRKGQDDDEFFGTADDVVRSLEAALKRLAPGDRRTRKALEIGCGPGRLMRPMSWNFGEIHGVDVSDEMIPPGRAEAQRACRTPFRAPPKARISRVTATRLSISYIPMRYSSTFPVRRLYSRTLPRRGECSRFTALRCSNSTGFLKPRKNTRPGRARAFPAAEVAEFACSHDFQLLSLEGADTQYMWVTMRKRPAGWFQALAANPPSLGKAHRSQHRQFP